MHWNRPKSHIAKAATKNNLNLRFKIKITCIRATNRRRIWNTKQCCSSVKTSCHHGPCRQTDKSEVWTLEARQLLENVPQSSQRFSKYPAGVKPFESGRKKKGECWGKHAHLEMWRRQERYPRFSLRPYDFSAEKERRMRVISDDVRGL